mgnify:CR=1 FL=1
MASLLPRMPLTLDNFRDAWASADWLSLYANTLIFTFGTFFVQLLTITTAGYVFACHEFRGKKTLFLMFLVQLMIMPVVMMVPNMLTLKTFGLLNTLTGVMMPYFTSAFGVFLMRQAFLAIPKELEEAALSDDYFVERKLYPNVDFYSGIIYKALKIPTEMFTVMFAIARTAGWISHWISCARWPTSPPAASRNTRRWSSSIKKTRLIASFFTR